MPGPLGVLIPMLKVKCMRSMHAQLRKIVVMFCCSVMLTLHKRQKEHYRGVFRDYATGTLKNRFKPYFARTFFRASEDWGEGIVYARFEHK